MTGPSGDAPLIGLYLFDGDRFDVPLYAEPPAADVDAEIWDAVTHRALAAVEGDEPHGTAEHGDWRIAWRVVPRTEVAIVAVVHADVPRRDVERYLKDLTSRYLDEVDDPAHPDRHGVADLVVDVLPPWEE